MAFNVAADAYDSFMGRYSVQLAAQLADLAGVQSGQRVVDVGCGPGALTKELVRRGAEVSAVDPSPQFVTAAAERFPAAHVEQATAEDLPFGDDEFDAALAQLVVHFMADPVAGLREMARVTRAGGVVVASVWDFAGGASPLTPFWRAARELDPSTEGESTRAGAGEGQLPVLFAQAGLSDVEETPQPVHVAHESFDEWWLPFTLGVGPAGEYYQGLEPEQQQALEEHLREQMPEPVKLETRAWAARGIV
jgi:ubiquinone/menaquinone biosynthesis C-methylase UbiE